MSLSTLLYTWVFGKFVGQDDFDNKYYCNSKNFSNKDFKTSPCSSIGLDSGITLSDISIIPFMMEPNIAMI